MSDTPWIDTQQLRVGLYVYLDLGWMDHPFAFSHFKINSAEQIDIIAGLGLQKVRYNPELSDEAVALAVASRHKAPSPAPVTDVARVPAAASPVMQAKQAMLAKIRQRREVAERIEKAFVATARSIRDIERNLYSQPAETLATATGLVADIADRMLTAPEMVIQVIGEKPGGEELYLHSLNVAVLAMMMAREMGLPRDVVSTLGLGALLHDIGQHDIPDRVRNKVGDLTPAERHFFEQHPVYGVAMAQRMHVSDAVLAVIAQHHEHWDGGGYPARLQGEGIALLARIVVITNYFDELCNPPALADALTPHEALSAMFARLQGKFDPQLLRVFIHCMGVYPPGSVVQLSNGLLALVSSVNTTHPMKPVVLVHDPSVPRDEAILLDMSQEPQLNISKSIRPAQVPREVLNYLSPRLHLSYYFDGNNSPSGKPGASKA